ncbi:transcription termination/antitermination protein NusA [Candidatus Peregrinibacteria bacterium]|nr:transcription termination/antitermination protein NusA [Candidatus Peregrinibacteria bacterium]
MQSQFLAAINQLCDEKNISKEVVLETIKAALRAAYRKDYGNRDQNIEVEFKEGSDMATIFLVKNVVKKVLDENIEISLKEAQKYKKDAQAGDVLKIDVTPVEYGRIAAQSAKQVIIQRLQEAEREIMYETFKNRENELLNVRVHRVENQQVYIDLEKIICVLPLDHQIPNERYYSGQRLKIYLDKVIKTTKGPQLLISRSHPNLVRKLLELEIPEIKQGLVDIKVVAREPGVRCKIAVHSSDPKIDPIGSCVGPKGVRIQNVMDELNGERIDIIQWQEKDEEFIKAALSPAKVAQIVLDKERRRASVYVHTDQRPLAIGKNGQNVRLASRLSAYEIDILDIAEIKGGEQAQTAQKTQTVTNVKDLQSITEEVVKKLETAHLTLVEQIKGLKVKDFMQIEGIAEEEAQFLENALKDMK